MNKYVNYHKHSMASNISSPDSTLTIDDYIKRAKELGHNCISTVEHSWHGGMTFILEAYEKCKQNNMKLLIGAESYFVKDRHEKDKSNYHIVLMCLNEDGRKELNFALSEANMNGYYYKPRIDYNLILNLTPQNFIITSACVAGLINDEEIIAKLHNHFKDNFFLEVQSHNHPTQIKVNQKVLELANKYNIEIIHGNDTHYITEQDRINRDIFLKGKGMDYGEETQFQLDYPSYDEIVERYKKQGVLNDNQIKKALSNTLIIEEKTDEFIFKDDIKMPTLYPKATHEEKIKKLKDIINEEFKKQYSNLPKEEKQKYFNALRFEMNIIEETSMEDYFLDNYYIVKRAKEFGGILTQTGRGSAVSFLINKLLGFTSIDRLQEEIELFPSRFMSKSRILETRSLPDIDMNLVSQEPFVEASRDILGEHSCYIMISYNYQMEKARIKNICRAIGINPNEANEITKDIESARKQNKYKELFEKVDNIGNIIESISMNACGHLIINGDIRREIGVMKAGDSYCAMIDKNTADKWKYLKNDYLIVSVWLLISEVYKEIGKPMDNIKNLKEMTLNDNKVWKLYEDGITATLNQTSTQSGRIQVMQYKPKNISELSHFVAGIRPSFESMKTYLLNRKEFSYEIPEFDKLLESSNNFLLYQEGIMSALVYAGIPEDETYGIIKAISKKKKNIIMNAKDRFIEGFIKKTGSEENAYKVWKIIEDASAYGFNASHSLSVAYDSLYGAYLKANYPVQYYAVALNINENDETITHDLISELDYFNIKLSDIKFGYSKSKYSYDLENKIIYKGLKSIKFMNEEVSEELYELSKRFNGDFIDLLKEITETTSCNSRQLKILISLNFFSDFGKRRYLMNIYELFSKRYKKNLKLETKQKRLIEVKEKIKEYKDEDFTIKEILQNEKEYTGYFTYKNNKIKNDIFFVSDIAGNYTNKNISLYRIKDGKTFNFKINKKTLDELEININSVVKVLEIVEKPKNIMIDGKWTQDENIKYKHITKIKNIKN